jgi:hypothetical protein
MDGNGMATGELTDADVFGALTPPQVAAAPPQAGDGSFVDAPTGAALNPAQTAAYHKLLATGAFDPKAEPGSAMLPLHQTKDGEEPAAGKYYVDLGGNVRQAGSAPAASETPPTPKEMSDADVFGADGPLAAQDAHAGPVSQQLGFEAGIAKPFANLGRWTLGGLEKLGADTSAIHTVASRLQAAQAEADAKEPWRKTATPGKLGEFGGELLATAPMAVDMLGVMGTGALQGALTTDSKDLKGTLIDAGLGAVGGKLADVALSGARKIIAPVIRPAAQWAIDNGIRLTPGGIAGGMAKSLETGASKGTIAGPMIGAAQRRGIEDFNLATARHVLDGTGLALPEGVSAGHEAINETHNLLSGAFNSLAPKLTLPIDNALTSARSEATNAGTLMPSAYRARMDALVGQLPVRGGAIDGRAVQDLTAQLRQEVADAAQSGDFFAKNYGRAVDKLRSAVEDGLERSNPGQAKTLQALRTAWAKQVRVERAGASAIQDGGVFTPKGLLTAVRGADQSARDNASARGEALLQDWANSGKDVLPDKLPNAGSLWAHLPELAVTYGVGHEAGVPGIAGMLAGEGAAGLLYTKPGQKIINAAMTKRPGFATSTADILKELQPLLSYGAATATPRLAPMLPALPMIAPANSR